MIVDISDTPPPLEPAMDSAGRKDVSRVGQSPNRRFSRPDGFHELRIARLPNGLAGSGTSDVLIFVWPRTNWQPGSHFPLPLFRTPSSWIVRYDVLSSVLILNSY